MGVVVPYPLEEGADVNDQRRLEVSSRLLMGLNALVDEGLNVLEDDFVASCGSDEVAQRVCC